MRRFAILLALAMALVAAAAAPSQAASGNWERTWGKNVDGGGVFESCTVAASCLQGLAGGLGGEMSGPTGVATDALGNVYVVEAGNNRVQKFDASGDWERAWGKNVNGGGVFGVCTVEENCLAGTTGVFGGEMDFPTSIATDALGNVYITDFDNNRVQKFDADGVWLSAWGKDVTGNNAGFGVCTMAASCQAGDGGGLGDGAAGGLHGPWGIATAGGKVYVSDTNNNRVQKFDASGTWELAWGWNINSSDGDTGFETCTPASSGCLVGHQGGGSGQLRLATGIATDAVGNVYVADTNNHRIQKFNSSGVWQRAWGRSVNGGGGFGICTGSCQAGTAGGLGGEMSEPRGLATDGAGNVYVADRLNHRIQRFDPSGTWQRAWGKNVNGGGVFGICTAMGSCLAGTAGGLGGEMNFPAGVATSGPGILYVADASNRRVQKFDDSAPAPPPPTTTPTTTPPPSGGAPGPTGKRAAALKKCKKVKKKKARAGCKKKANKLPL